MCLLPACIRRHRRRAAWRRLWIPSWRRRVQLCLLFVMAPAVAGLVIFAIIAAYKPWPLSVIVRHVAAAPNCAFARIVGLAPARWGEAGYYPHHDADRDGIACEPWHPRHHDLPPVIRPLGIPRSSPASRERGSSWRPLGPLEASPTRARNQTVQPHRRGRACGLCKRELAPKRKDPRTRHALNGGRVAKDMVFAVRL
jgi:hypothetical protein